ncbi:hypothetical protein FNU76_02005 [Chitinimonas arctica]|uniref:HDOD domain-containing protein n=1 Tax=Chitinimonas arctica TaxID=2594795 RepID=A0A516SAR3_9NEIS|nr:hypothetical protein [Chitinimonas arctica]QDQ25221.1 hypothetical protein FNU76_02005 [Chitinimonas arctica]
MANALSAAPPAAQPKQNERNEAWLTFWARRPLPILQSTKAALAGFAGRLDTVRSDEIIAAVLRDPLLTAHILRHINQRKRGSLASDVVALESVVLLMGVDAFVGQFARLATVESMLLPKHPARYFALLREVATTRLAARLAKDFSELRYDAHPEEINIAALLGHMPRMLRLLEAGLPDAAPASDLDELPPLFARWSLPEVFSSLLDHRSPSSQRSLLQQAAVRLADKLQMGWWQDGVAADVHLAAHSLEMEQAEVWQLICGALLHFARKDWPYAQIFPPARWLPMLPGEWPRPQAKAAPEAAGKPSFDSLLRELQRAGQGSGTFNQIMNLSIRAQAEGLGMKRIVFGLLMAGHNLLKTRYVVGAADDDPLRSLQVDLTAPHLFTRLMLKPQSIWLKPGNRAQFEALLPRGVRQAVGEGDFVAMSLFVDDKPVGLFYADNHGGPLTEAQYNGFKQVCQLTGQCLTWQAGRLSRGG